MGKRDDFAGIYGIYCKATEKWYVGASKQVTRRLKDHMRELAADSRMYLRYKNKWGFKYKGEMGKDFAIYGEASFSFHILQRVNDVSTIGELERYWVDRFDAITNGYNKQNYMKNRFWK